MYGTRMETSLNGQNLVEDIEILYITFHEK